LSISTSTPIVVVIIIIMITVTTMTVNLFGRAVLKEVIAKPLAVRVVCEERKKAIITAGKKTTTIYVSLRVYSERIYTMLIDLPTLIGLMITGVMFDSYS